MSTFRTKLAAWTATAALGTASLFAATTGAANGPAVHHRHGAMGAFLASYLNLTPQQQAQRKAIFQNLRQSSMPVRQELRQTRGELRNAVRANDTAKIQQLAKTEGSEVGQLAAMRGEASAKSYQILTPQQKQELAKLRGAHQAARRGRRGAGAGA
jgi:Spy/CpxP family protein refolding chaperone